MQRIAFSYIQKITKLIEKCEPTGNGLFDGRCQKLLYYFELYRATGDSAYLQQVNLVQDQLDAEISNGKWFDGKMGLSSGLAGFALVIEWLYESGLLRPGLGLHRPSIDDLLLEKSQKKLQDEPDDFLGADLGILYYFLSKKPSASSFGSATDILSGITDRYALLGPLDFFYGAFGTSNELEDTSFGIHRGLCGVLLVMMEAYKAGYCGKNDVIRKIIEEGVRLLVQHKLDIDYDEQVYSFFPASFSHRSGQIKLSNRLCWGNGDLNEVLVFYKMHEVTGRRYYREMADYIGVQSTSRRYQPETLVVDSSLGNGTAGLAQFYKQLGAYGATETYGKAYVYWLEQTILYLDNELSSHDRIEKKIDFLKGLTGTSLVLLNFWYPKLSNWSRMLLF